MPASVSVVVPTWNRADTIRGAVESALRQSHPVLEVLVCDDGSTDDTRWVVQDIARQDPRVRWIEGARVGRPAIPRNRGLHESRGEWVAFLDSDDTWYPQKLETQLNATASTGALAACSNAIRVDSSGRRIGMLLDWTRPRIALGDLLVENHVVCSSCVVHRSVLARTGGFPEQPKFKAIEDYVLWLRVSAVTDFAFCPDALVEYRDDPANGIRSTQTISPAEQRTLVLAATKKWLRISGLGLARRFAILVRVWFAQVHFRFATITRRLKAGAIGDYR